MASASVAPAVVMTSVASTSSVDTGAQPLPSGWTADLQIPGTVVTPDVASQVLEKVRSLCGWTHHSFPGSQPVSLTRNSLVEISRNPYVACEKTDGLRLLLFAAARRVFLIDRLQVVREVRMHLPRLQDLQESHQVTLLDGEIVCDVEEEEEQVQQEKEQKHQLESINEMAVNCNKFVNVGISPSNTTASSVVCFQSTIKDMDNQNFIPQSRCIVKQLFAANEKVNANDNKPNDDYIYNFYEDPLSVADKSKQDGTIHSKSRTTRRRSFLRYLVYDCIAIQRDNSIKDTNLFNRLATIYKEVIQPIIRYKQLLERQQQCLNWPFEIYLKDFYEIWDIEVIKNYSSKLSHVSDGIIFTPIRLPYISGTCQQLLKWKPIHLNTVLVDFSVEFVYDDDGKPRLIQLFVAKQGFRIFMGHFCAPFGDVYKALLDRASRGSASGIIVECYWASEKPVMTFLPKLKDSKANLNKTSTSSYISKRKLDEIPSYDLTRGSWVTGGWVAERIRLDKNVPNDYRTVNQILESIDQGITFDDLNIEFQKYRKRGKIGGANFCILPSY